MITLSDSPTEAEIDLRARELAERFGFLWDRPHMSVVGGSKAVSVSDQSERKRFRAYARNQLMIEQY